MKKLSAAIVFFLLLLNNTAYSQGEAALSFLLLNTGAVSSGMGYASTAHISDDPFAVNYNPAQLGIHGLDRYLAYSTTNSVLLPNFYVNSTAKGKVINAGFSFGGENKGPKFAVGFGFSDLTIDYPEFSVNNAPLYNKNDIDKYEKYTFAIGFDYIVKASFGYAYKNVTSTIMNYTKEVKLYDLGALIELPVMPLVNKFNGKQIYIYNKYAPVFNISAGISRSNLGEESIYYVDPSQADPLPRFARAGIGITLGIETSSREFNFSPIMFKWTVEENDMLVNSSSNGFSYQDGLGDIKFFDNVIMGKTNEKTEKLKGWELELLETVTFYGGKFTENINYGNRNFSTSGWAISFKGALKGLTILDNSSIVRSDFIRNLLRHVDIKYTSSKITTNDPTNPLNNQKVHSFTLIYYH